MAIFFALIGPRAAYAVMAFLARRLYRLSDPLRSLSETQCRAALSGQRRAAEIPHIAEQAFVHRAWNLVDLMLADRLIRRGTYQRYGGRFPEPYLSMLLDARRRRRPVLLLTCYCGPYDLLPLFLGFNGIRAGAVYRPHLNPEYDAYRCVIRARGGCEMIPDHQAVTRLPQILENGGTAAILTDHHAARRGIPVAFLGLETAAARTVGLLAARYETVVVVAGIRRQDDAFRFEINVADLFDADAWRQEADPVDYITRRYIAGMEQIVLANPSQYLWARSRWGADATRMDQEMRGTTRAAPRKSRPRFTTN